MNPSHQTTGMEQIIPDVWLQSAHSPRLFLTALKTKQIFYGAGVMLRERKFEFFRLQFFLLQKFSVLNIFVQIHHFFSVVFKHSAYFVFLPSTAQRCSFAPLRRKSHLDE